MLTEDFQALLAHFNAGWTINVVTIYDNQPNVDVPENEIWCRFSVRLGASTHHAGGSQEGVKRQLGRVWLQVMVPSEIGTGEALELIDAFSTLFRNARLDGGAIHLKTEEVGAPVKDGDGWLVMTVSIPFESYRRYV